MKPTPDVVLDLVMQGLEAFAKVGDEKLEEMERDGIAGPEAIAGMRAGTQKGFEAAIAVVRAVRATCHEWESTRGGA